MTESEFIKRAAQAISAAATPAEAAESVYRACVDAANAWGMTPAIEVAIRKPGERRHHDDINCWSVVFEAGPYQWAVAASLNVDTKGKVLAEPYYSFDLCFSEV